MSDPLAITAEDAEGLARLAQAQLRLALRFAERAEAEEDVDDACRLARASERAARGYRQALLIKSRLQRERDAAPREAGPPPPTRSPQEDARRFRRQRELYEAVERIACEAVEDHDDRDFLLVLLSDHIDMMMAQDEDFADADLQAQVARICDAFDLDAAPAPAGPTDGCATSGSASAAPQPAGPEPAGPDSS